MTKKAAASGAPSTPPKAEGIVGHEARTSPKAKSPKTQVAEAKRKQQADREAAAALELELFRLDIAESEESVRTATEHLVEALRLGTSQRAAAEAVKKSVAWVNRLAKWAQAGYPACGPFSAESKAKRKRAAKSVQAPEQPTAGIGHNHPPADPPAIESGRETIEFPAHQDGSPVFIASAERPIEQVRAEFATLAGEEVPPTPATDDLSIPARLDRRGEAALPTAEPATNGQTVDGGEAFHIGLSKALNTAIALCGVAESWPEMSIKDRNRRDKAVDELRALTHALVALATPTKH